MLDEQLLEQGVLAAVHGNADTRAFSTRMSKNVRLEHSPMPKAVQATPPPSTAKPPVAPADRPSPASGPLRRPAPAVVHSSVDCQRPAPTMSTAPVPAPVPVAFRSTKPAMRNVPGGRTTTPPAPAAALDAALMAAWMALVWSLALFGTAPKSRTSK
jgi:hypothetical protein